MRNSKPSQQARKISLMNYNSFEEAVKHGQRSLEMGVQSGVLLKELVTEEKRHDTLASCRSFCKGLEKYSHRRRKEDATGTDECPT
jgi:hypothetical protein